jgi:DUF971 family protein
MGLFAVTIAGVLLPGLGTASPKRKLRIAANPNPLHLVCDTQFMQSPLQSPTAATDPKSVKVNVTAGTGVDIVWSDGHVSHYSFVFLRDACPCAMCEDERGKSGRPPGEAPKLVPGELPMFKPTAKPVSAEGVGKYAIKFSWNDGHDLGIYSWRLLRELCPCQECQQGQEQR